MAANVTQVLQELAEGDKSALQRLVPLVYQELHNLAEAFLSHERPGHTLQPTALVNEAYLKLVDQQKLGWNDRTHFFAAAAQAMRHVLIDAARRRSAQKRGGGQDQIALDAALLSVYESSAKGTDVVTLDAALTKLAAINSLTVRVVELRFFGGMAIDEAAAALDISASTVEREWRYARAWLRQELGESRAR